MKEDAKLLPISKKTAKVDSTDHCELLLFLLIGSNYGDIQLSLHLFKGIHKIMYPF